MLKISKLKDKQAKLEKYKQILDTHLLVSLNINSLEQVYDLNLLDRSVRDLVTKLESGLKTTDQLLAGHIQQVTGHFDRRFDDQEHRRHMEERRNTFMKSLFFPDIEARHEQVAEAFRGTCRWVLEPLEEAKEQRRWPDFRDWLKNGTGVYWISGKPGSGKSTLMKYIVHEPQTKQYLEDWALNARPIIASFFFWNLGTRLQKTTAGLLRSLLYQIAAQWEGIIDVSRDHLEDPGTLDLLRTWTDRRLLSTLKFFLDQKPATVMFCAFIDGLDEIAEDEDQLLEIVRLLSESPGCKICVSSRPEQTFRQEYQDCRQLRVQDLNKEDLTKMVAEKLKPCLEKDVVNDRNSIDRFVYNLVSKAEGVFLWLDLMTKEMVRGAKNGDTLKELSRRLKRTPADINGLYQQILTRLDPEYRKDALRYFMILIVGSEIEVGLTLLGLFCADDTNWKFVEKADRSYFCDPQFDDIYMKFRQRLTARCGSFIDIRQDQDQVEGAGLSSCQQDVRFVHRTAGEFLKMEYKAFLNEPSNQSFSCILLTRSYIGLMFLYPITCKLRDDEEVYKGDHLARFSRLIDTAMSGINHADYTGEYLVSNKICNDAVQTTAQAFETLRILLRSDEVFIKKALHGGDYTIRDLWREFWEYRLKIRRGEDQHSFPDHMSMAIFWGCRSYFQSKMSMMRLGDKAIQDTVLAILEEIRSGTELLTWKTVDKEWRAGGSDWSEEIGWSETPGDEDWPDNFKVDSAEIKEHRALP
ncbi:MAG: hypothetical protein LQ352_005181 [Teloschistes flavicans]|nr:MAG: hypothetical protein LQ352_005181 [Teloschistes flavicans]